MMIQKPTTINAQDTLYRSNGKKEFIRIQELNDSMLVYKNYNNMNGPLYSIRMQNVEKIVYADNRIYTPVIAVKKTKRGKSTKAFAPLKQHHIMLNTFDLLYNTITFQYMYLFKSNTIGIRIPFSIGASHVKTTQLDPSSQKNRLGYYNPHKLWSSGADFLFFPFHSNVRFRFYVGPSFEFGQFKYIAYNNQNYDMPAVSHNKAVLLQYGFLLQGSRRIHFSIGAALGASEQVITNYYLGKSYGANERGLAFRASINLGYIL